jgi:ABC-type thiamine transport system substrate-binding protein
MKYRWAIIVLMVVAVAGCAAPAGAPQGGQPAAIPGAAAKPVLTVMTHDSFSISEAALAVFQEQC